MDRVGRCALFGDLEFADFRFGSIAGAVGCCGCGGGFEVCAVLVRFVVGDAEGVEKLV